MYILFCGQQICVENSICKSKLGWFPRVIIVIASQMDRNFIAVAGHPKGSHDYIILLPINIGYTHNFHHDWSYTLYPLGLLEYYVRHIIVLEHFNPLPFSYYCNIFETTKFWVDLALLCEHFSISIIFLIWRALAGL